MWKFFRSGAREKSNDDNINDSGFGWFGRTGSCDARRNRRESTISHRMHCNSGWPGKNGLTRVCAQSTVLEMQNRILSSDLDLTRRKYSHFCIRWGLFRSLPSSIRRHARDARRMHRCHSRSLFALGSCAAPSAQQRSARDGWN